MARYIDIKSIAELDSVQRKLHQDIKDKGKQVTGSVSDIRSFYRPTNMLSMGIKSFIESPTADTLLIGIIRRLIRKRSE